MVDITMINYFTKTNYNNNKKCTILHLNAEAASYNTAYISQFHLCIKTNRKVQRIKLKTCFQIQLTFIK